MSSGRAGRELRAWSPECEASPPPLASLFAGPNMQGPNLHGIMGQLAGKVRLASATHRSACTQHRPCAIAAKRAEVHQGHEDERDHVGQRDHVQLANNTQGCDQGCRIMSRRSQGGGRSVAPAQRPPRCLPALCLPQVGTHVRSCAAYLHACMPPSLWHPGTNMAFVGFKKPTDSADVVAFLNKNK